MSTRILLVEDDELLTLVLRYNLEAQGYTIEAVTRGDEADCRLRESLPDLAILDWVLPGLSGIELCRRIRSRNGSERLPVMMLTARAHEADRVRGLDTGADDILVKPFSLPEFLARVRALLRRCRPTQAARSLVVGDVELDRKGYRVLRRGDVVHLGPTEFRLLEFLMQSPGRVFTREEMLTGVWQHGVQIDRQTVDVYVLRLRRALDQVGSIDLIRTVRGVGYSLDETFAHRGETAARRPDATP